MSLNKYIEYFELISKRLIVRFFDATRFPIRGSHVFAAGQNATILDLKGQAQIVLGKLILLTLAMRTVLHRLFYGLSDLLGVGLNVPIVTARCGLEDFLAHMPRDRSK